MSGNSKRSLFTIVTPRRRSRVSEENLDVSLAAGKAERRDGQTFETLEPRVLLSGDHPSLVDFPTASEITLDVDTGRGTIAGELEVVNDDDLFKFTAPATDFVTIQADGSNPARRAADGTPLDTQIKIFDSTGALIAQSSGDGEVTAGIPTDAWFGFVATAGEEYFVNVLSDSDQTDDGTGEYILRVDGTSMALATDVFTGEANFQDVIDATDPPAILPLVTGALGLDDIHTITPDDEFSGDDVVYSLSSLSGSFYDSIASASVFADVNDLDTRLEIFDSNGELVTDNSQAAFLNDPFVTFRSSPDTSYFVRIRSDEFEDPAVVNSAGEFGLKIDLAAEEIVLDPISRRGMTAQPVRNQPPGLLPLDNPVLLTPSDFGIFRFQSKGFGQAFVTGIPVGPPQDLQLTIIDFEGNQIAFVDDLIGTTPELRLELDGGQEYFIVVGGFDDTAGGEFQLFAEAHHNVNVSDDFTTDDHPNSHDLPTGLTTEERQRLFENATAVNFGAPFATIGPDGNPLRDRGYRQSAFIQGRIWDADPADSNAGDNKDGIEEDTDLFSFVPPIDMLGEFAGNNDDVGTALFVGGEFSGAEQLTQPVPADSPGLAIFDAFDWWAAGHRPTLQDPTGIRDNGATPESDGPVVYALQEVNIGGAPALVVGGDFTVVAPNTNPALPPITVTNLAVWSFHGALNRYAWNGDLGSADGIVRAVADYTPAEEVDSTGDGTADVFPNPGQYLVIGGEFSQVNGAPTGGLAQLNLTLLPAIIWEGLDGIDGPVYALEVYDPPNPGAGRAPPTNAATLDVVVINRDTPVNSIAALQNEDGSGVTLGDPQPFGTGLVVPNTIISADFLGAPGGGGPDEAIDIAVLDPVLREVTVFENNADGTLPPAQGVAIDLGLSSNQVPQDMFAADLIGDDGLIDIAVVSSSSNSDTGRLVILQNEGDGVFTTHAPITINTLEDSELSIDGGDLLDDDGDIDLAIGDSERDLVYVAQNFSSGGGPVFSFSEITINAFSSPVDVAVGDLNGDDILDIATANAGNDTAKVIFNNGNGTFDNSTNPFTSGGTEPSGIQLAPMRAGDDANDIILVNEGSSSVTILNHQDGFLAGASFDTNPDALDDAPADLAVGDMNGDGRLDVVTVNTLTDTVSVLLGTGNQTLTLPAQRFETGEENVNDRPIGLTLVDIDVELEGVLLEVPNPPDPPNSLFIGGSFTVPVETFYGDTVVARNIASWNGDSFRPASFGSSEVDGGNPVIAPSETNGPVYALEVHNPSMLSLEGEPIPIGPMLYIGGDFSEAGDLTGANNVVRMGRVDETQDPEAPGYSPNLRWERLGNGTDGPVYALANFLPPEIEGQQFDTYAVIAIGGEFTMADGQEAHNVAMQGLEAFGPMGTGLQ